MNKKAETTVLEVIIGVVIAGVVFTITTLMITDLINIGDAEVDSFYELIDTIKDIQKDSKQEARGIMIFAHRDESYLYPSSKDSKKILKDWDKELERWVDIPLPHKPECEKDVCYCLCQKIEAGTCASGELYCEILPNVKFSPGTDKIVSKRWYPNAAQRSRVRIIKCQADETFCKQSEQGDISVIFDLLDQNNLYQDIK